MIIVALLGAAFRSSEVKRVGWGHRCLYARLNLAKAAVHTGLLHAGETGIVLVEFTWSS